MLQLTAERLRRRWSKAELARRARLDQANVSRIEAGRMRPYAVELARLARALGVKPTEAERLLDDLDGNDALANGVANVVAERHQRGRNI